MDILTLASSSKGNCYRIDDGETPILLECGIPLVKLRKLLNFKLSNIAACLCTHEHKDHSEAIPGLLRAGCDCWMTNGTAKALGVDGHRVHILQVAERRDNKVFYEQVEIGSWTVLPFQTVHDAAEPVGFLLVSGDEKLLFATDTQYVWQQFRGITHLMLERNYDPEVLEENIKNGKVPACIRDRLIQAHMSTESVKTFLEEQDLSACVYQQFIHESGTNLWRDEDD